MWAHRPWVGRFLPPGTPTGSELSIYSRLLTAVEGNTTFYASPIPSTVAKWAEQAAPGFEFVFKVPQIVTHERRLRDVDDLIAAFCELMTPLGERVGGLTLQLPASFAPTDLGVLGGLLRRLPGGWRWSVEVRHPQFFDGPARDALDRILSRAGVERVLLDSRPLFAQAPLTDIGRLTYSRKPRIPALTRALTDRPIVRVIGSDDPAVTAVGLARWPEIVAAWLEEGRSPTVFVHTPDNLDSPWLARRFHETVGRLVPALLPLAPMEALAPTIRPESVDAAQGSLF